MTDTVPEKKGSKKLLFSASVKFLMAMVFIGAILFIPAGTLRFLNGWVYMICLMLPMLSVLIFLALKDPELLAKRMNTREKEKAQKKYVALSTVLFIVGFILPGLDFRYGWSRVPAWAVVTAVVFILAGYATFIAVIIQNRYASRVIEIQNGQKLIDSGLYRIVRHPMYLAATILYLASPVVLGSWFALLPVSILPFLLAFRILNEEKILREGLPGYTEYTQRVKYRMIPYIW